jgi:hypothetical protein
MTREESAIISAFTGIMCGPFDAFHEYAEKIMGRPVFTHEMGNKEIADQIKEKSMDDFMALAGSVSKSKYIGLNRRNDG